MFAREGDVVLVHYTGMLPDGTVFDSSKDREPMRIALGKGEVIPGFERAIIGMKQGGFVIENIPAQMAFGEVSDSCVWDVERPRLDGHETLAVGEMVHVPVEDGSRVCARIVDVFEDRVKVDANHPLAGQDLTFEIELLEILSGAGRYGRVPPGARESKIILG